MKTKSNEIRTVDDLIKRISKMNKNSNTIQLRVLTDEVREFCEEMNYKIIDADDGGYLINVKELNNGAR